MFLQRIKCFQQIRLFSLSSVSYKDGIFQYSKLSSKAHIRIRGPDTIKFLNGQITSKLQPYFVKKNLTTINENDLSQDKSKTIVDFPMNKSNWGLYQEVGTHGEFITRFGQYTGFLNGKGKLITDSIIYPTPLYLNEKSPNNYPEYLLEFDKEIINEMLRDIESHKLASKIKVNIDSNIKCWDVLIQFTNIPKNVENPWIDNLLDPMSQMKTPKDANQFCETVIKSLFKNIRDDDFIGAYVDRRFDKLVYRDGSSPQIMRILTSSNIEDIGEHFNQAAFPFEFSIVRQDDNGENFDKIRMNNGMIDGIRYIRPETVLPLELNFDYLPNVINSNKGCYVGQELTARTISTDILRKRLVPVRISNASLLDGIIPSELGYIDVELNDKYADSSSGCVTRSSPLLAPSPFGSSDKTTIIRKRKRPVGTLVAHRGDIGLMILRTEYFSLSFDKDPGVTAKFVVTVPNSDKGVVGITPQKPMWYQDWKDSNK